MSKKCTVDIQQHIVKIFYMGVCLFDGGFLVFDASFNNMPVLLVEETRENHPPVRKSLTNFITSCCTPHPD